MPQGVGQRLPHLDLLRGIAVLGLLFMNLPSMGILEIGYVRLVPDITSDQIIVSLQAILFDGRFRSLFCLLFGIGLYLQYQSYLRKQLNAYVILKSRVNWLFIFGLIHCIFIWPGDILIMYALSGLYLISKLDWEANKLLKRGTIFLVIGLVIMSIEIFATASFSEGTLTRDSDTFKEAIGQLELGYLNTLFANFVVALIFIITFPILTLFYIGGVMLIGIGLFKSGKLQQGFNKREIAILAAVTILLSAFDALFAFFWPHDRQQFIGIPGTISGLTMALLVWHYVVTLNLASRKSILNIALQRAGKMAFTLYISQSIVMAGVFRYLMPELAATFTMLDYTVITVSFILLQLIFAYWYFEYFQQGPLEKMWRKLVDKKIRQQQAQLASSATIEQNQATQPNN